MPNRNWKQWKRWIWCRAKRCWIWVHRMWSHWSTTVSIESRCAISLVLNHHRRPHEHWFWTSAFSWPMAKWTKRFGAFDQFNRMVCGRIWRRCAWKRDDSMWPRCVWAIWVVLFRCGPYERPWRTIRWRMRLRWLCLPSSWIWLRMRNGCIRNADDMICWIDCCRDVVVSRRRCRSPNDWIECIWRIRIFSMPSGWRNRDKLPKHLVSTTNRTMPRIMSLRCWSVIRWHWR